MCREYEGIDIEECLRGFADRQVGGVFTHRLRASGQPTLRGMVVLSGRFDVSLQLRF